jgi:hypothetical protein
LINSPSTRLGRVVQQLRSFGELHANELESLAVDLDNAGASEAASRLRAYSTIQRDEADMVVQELVDIQADLGDDAPPQPAGADPAENSARRAKWLAEQEAEAERLREPLSRRELFNRVAQKDDESQD